MTTAQISAEQDPGTLLRGDRMYAALRWLILSAIGSYGVATRDFRLWPPDVWNVASLAFWGLAFWTLIATVLVVMPTLRTRFWLHAGDLLGFAGLAYAAPDTQVVYAILVFPPLVVGGLRASRRELVPLSLLAGIVGALIQFSPTDQSQISSLGRFVIFAAIPWLVHLLSEQWIADNRRLVRAAEDQASAALAHAEQYRERMRALYEAAITLSATSSAQSVLDAMLNACAKLVPYRASAVLLPMEARDEVGVSAGHNLLPSELQTRFLVGGGLLGTLLRGGNGGVLPESTKAELSPLPSLMGCRSILLLPLRAARRTYGVLIVGSDEKQFTSEQMEMVNTLAGYSIVALQNARLTSDLRDERATLLDRESEMRRRLNRDLHDGPAQALAAITMNLEFIKHLLEREPERVPDELNKVIRLAQRSNHEVRTLLFELHPMTLEAQGLVATLRRYVERFADSPTKLILESSEIEPLDCNVQTILFTIAQEAVNNAFKHAQAHTILIRLNRTNDQVTMRIEDDGRGFDLEKIREKRGSFGLLTIKERARLVNGTVQLRSAPDTGTSVDVQIPLE